MNEIDRYANEKVCLSMNLFLISMVSFHFTHAATGEQNACWKQVRSDQQEGDQRQFC
jgi:hypothetical protein